MYRAELEFRLLEGLGDHSDAWDRLVERQRVPSPFLRSWWIEHAMGADPVIPCWFDRGELVGGAAFERDRPGRGALSLERLRSPGQGVLAPDHLDLIATDEHRAEITRSLLAWLHRPGSRLVDLDGLAAEGTLATAFGAEVIEVTGAPYALLPTDHDEYFKARPGRVRSTIQRTGRRFERSGLRHRSVEPADAARALDDLARLHEGRWADQSAFLSAWPRFRAAAMAGMQAGEVTIDEIVTAEGEVVATELDFVVAGRTSFYQAGRNTDREWRGGGSVLRRAIIDRAIASGHSEYDLLRGDEAYKSDWSEQRREVVRCRAAIGPLGSALVAAIAARRRYRAAMRVIRPKVAGFSPGAWRPGRGPRPEQPD